MPPKTLILGRGLAGSILSLSFHARGIPHDIIDAPMLSASSRIAAGVVNPLVLKRLKLVDNAAQFLQTAQSFYHFWEKQWNTKFYYPTPIHHIFHQTGESNLWVEKSDNEAYAPYLGQISNNAPSSIKAAFGVGIMENTAWLDTSKFLELHLDYHQRNSPYLEQEISQETLAELQKKYECIVVCSGQLMRKLIPATAGAFSPTRGEVMIIETDALPWDAIYHGPVFILPLGRNLFKVGATYHWDNLEDTATPDGLAQLKTGLEKIFSGNYRIVDHLAGVRPNTKDRKPILGRISDGLYSFNGLGSRGVLMAPSLADLLAENFSGHTPFPDKYNIQRFLAQ